MEERYKFIKEVGRGTFGCVYKAIDKENGKTVAIKKIEERYESWQTCFNSEVVALKKFGGHPNIISLKQVLKDASDNTLYLVFEYMPYDLHNFIKKSNEKGTFFGETQIKKWCFQILSGLEYMHRGGCFHRDLKPGNMLVSESGVELKIADFGSARMLDDKTPCTEHVGTRWYRAPEVMFGSKNYSPAVDMWAVGAILAELYTGRPLFPGKSREDQIYKTCSVIGIPTVDDIVAGYPNEVMNYKFPSIYNNNIARLVPCASKDAISLIKSLCSWNPMNRPTATQALQHHFFDDLYTLKRNPTANYTRRSCLMTTVAPPGFQPIPKNLLL